MSKTRAIRTIAMDCCFSLLSPPKLRVPLSLDHPLSASCPPPRIPLNSAAPPPSPESLEEASGVVEIEGGEGRLGVVERAEDQLVSGCLDEQLLAHLHGARSGSKESGLDILISLARQLEDAATSSTPKGVFYC